MLEYNTDYYFHNNACGRIYKVQLESIDPMGDNLFKIIGISHEGWDKERLPPMKHNFHVAPNQLQRNIYDNKDYLLIRIMARIGRTGPFFEHNKQLDFYNELFILLEKYPDQYLKFVDKTFWRDIESKINNLNLYNTLEKGLLFEPI